MADIGRTDKPMSNRKKVGRTKITPPAAIAAYAARYQCFDCDSTVRRPRRDGHGLWHVAIQHDPTCPLLLGRVSRYRAGIAAARATLAADATVTVAIVDGPAEETRCSST